MRLPRRCPPSLPASGGAPERRPPARAENQARGGMSSGMPPVFSPQGAASRRFRALPAVHGRPDCMRASKRLSPDIRAAVYGRLDFIGRGVRPRAGRALQALPPREHAGSFRRAAFRPKEAFPCVGTCLRTPGATPTGKTSPTRTSAGLTRRRGRPWCSTASRATARRAATRTPAPRAWPARPLPPLRAQRQAQ